jgi:hypothetical protein
MSCTDLAHDNAYDPKNPKAEAAQIAVAENFVVRYTNLNAVPSYVWYSQDALYELKGTYEGRLLILEYHMEPAGPTVEDTLASTENNLRYENEYRGSTPRGFPHVFFGGRQTGIQGASSRTVARDRYKTILDTMTVKRIQLYAQLETVRSAQDLQIETRVVRYGESAIGSLLAELFIVEDIGDSLHYTVRAHLHPETITSIEGGEIYELPLKTYTIPVNWNADRLSAVVLIKDAVSRKILQAAVSE